ncbi:hypothetical protein MKZ20_14845 [Psychrobacillus sp. FSL K6-2684]|jgi:hypothetical protein|uniref:HEPN domain-containing protein n=1 Tax=Psychrobacillus faecigallinarum TaxID=2762235 RepID=A0ABR8RDT2_9BACI|nr:MULTISPECIES: hypothetical protein [Psychrobacillus]MBD7945822.1 hypothetical protein [Psychrobacillus faecigallinarum]QEY22447.1 hypothetical protein D0S48_18280 [Psychrobacillus sp. AK 1817]
MYWPRKKGNFKFVDKESIPLLEIKNTGDIEREFYVYSENFISAANLLVNHVLETNENTKKDFWLFGLTYLYRQSLELILKSIAFKYITIKNDRVEFIGRVRHNLKYAYDEISLLVPADDLSLKEREREWLKTFLTNISECDEQSDMFRYPFSIKMKAFFQKQTHINLRVLGTNMNTAYKLLTMISNKADEIDHKDLIKFKPEFLMSSGSYLEQAVIWKGFNNNNYYPYIQGYMESGKYLYELIKDDQKVYLFLPMCYMYRNGIELALKRILVEDCQFDNQTAANKMKNKKHSIEGLWNVIKNYIIISSDVPDDSSTINDVELYIKQLHNLDITSDKFRYPINKFLKFHFDKKVRFDVTNVSLCFYELFTFLDAVDSMLSHQNEILAEMELEARRELESDYERY